MIAVRLALSTVALVAVTFGVSEAIASEGMLLVSVSLANGEPVAGLLADDFRVSVGGRAADVVEAQPARYPLVLLVDTSASARESITRWRNGAQHLARRSARGPLALYTFGGSPAPVVGLTDDAERVARAVDTLFGRTDASAYALDGLLRVARDLEKLEAPTALVVLIWSGGFDAGDRDMASVVAHLGAARVRVHVLAHTPLAEAVMLDPGARHGRARMPTDMLQQAAFEQSARLRNIAVSTGGTFEQVSRERGGHDVSAAVASLLQRLTGEYLVRYSAAGAGRAGVRVAVPEARLEVLDLTPSPPSPPPRKEIASGVASIRVRADRGATRRAPHP